MTTVIFLLEDIAENMKELDFINAHLGGHAITVKGFKKLMGSSKKISICEIGCGGGDNINALATFCTKNKIDAKFTGIDINAECIDYAKEKSTDKKCEIYCFRLQTCKLWRPRNLTLYFHHFFAITSPMMNL